MGLAEWSRSCVVLMAALLGISSAGSTLAVPLRRRAGGPACDLTGGLRWDAMLTAPLARPADGDSGRASGHASGRASETC